MNITDTLEQIKMARGGGFNPRRRRYRGLMHVDVPNRRYMDGDRLDAYNDQWYGIVDDMYGNMVRYEGNPTWSYEDAVKSVPYEPVVNPLGRGIKSMVARHRGQTVSDDIDGEKPYHPYYGTQEY